MVTGGDPQEAAVERLLSAHGVSRGHLDRLVGYQNPFPALAPPSVFSGAPPATALCEKSSSEA